MIKGEMSNLIVPNNQLKSNYDIPRPVKKADGDGTIMPSLAYFAPWS